MWLWLSFGTSKLKNAGKDLGSAVKGFKEAVKEEEKPKITNNDGKVIIAEEVKVEKPKDNRSADL